MQVGIHAQNTMFSLHSCYKHFPLQVEGNSTQPIQTTNAIRMQNETQVMQTQPFVYLLFRIPSASLQTDYPAENCWTKVIIRSTCYRCNQQNDSGYNYCQQCGSPPRDNHSQNEQHTVNQVYNSNATAVPEQDHDIQLRLNQLQQVQQSSSSGQSQSAILKAFNSFLQQPHKQQQKQLSQATPTDVAEFMAYKDTHGRGRTAVHSIYCRAIATHNLSQCDQEGTCHLRLAYSSMRTNVVVPLKMAFRQIGRYVAWDLDETGSTQLLPVRCRNPTDSRMVSKQLELRKLEQRTAGVQVKQAVTLRFNKLITLIHYMQADLCRSHTTLQQLIIKRDMAFFVLIFVTMERGLEVCKLLIRKIVRTPHDIGLYFDFVWGKTLRASATHSFAITRNMTDDPLVCAVELLDDYMFDLHESGWDVSKGFVFPTINNNSFDQSIVKAITHLHTCPAEMNIRFQKWMRDVGLFEKETLHSFRSGGAIYRALDHQQQESEIMQISIGRSQQQ